MDIHLYTSDKQDGDFALSGHENPDQFAISFLNSVSPDDKNRIGIIDNLIRYSPIILKHILDSDVDQLNDDALKDGLLSYLNSKNVTTPQDVAAPDNSTNDDFIRSWGSRSTKMLSSQKKIYTKLKNDGALLPTVSDHLRSKIIYNMINRKNWRDVTNKFLQISPYELLETKPLIIRGQMEIPDHDLARILTAIHFDRLHPEIDLASLNEINPYISSQYPEWFSEKGISCEINLRSVRLNPLTISPIINGIMKSTNIARNAHITDLVKPYFGTPLLHHISTLITEAEKTGKIIHSSHANKHGMAFIHLEDFHSNKTIKKTIDAFATICHKAIKRDQMSDKTTIIDFINSNYPNMHHSPLDDFKVVAEFSQNMNLKNAIIDAEDTYFHAMSHKILKEIDEDDDAYIMDMERVL
jgi:hypothetical protein